MDIGKAIQTAYQHYQAGDFGEARLICDEILKEQPENEEILYLLGIVLAELEEYDQAIGYLESSVQLSSRKADGYLALGAVFQKKGAPDEAVKQYMKAIEIDPDFAEAYANLGDIFRDKKQFDEAVQYYKKALQYMPDSAEIYCSLGNIFMARTQSDLAAYYYRKALMYDDDCAEAHNNLGTIFLEQKRLDEAIMHYRKALKIDPHLPGAHARLEGALDEMKQYEDAVNRYKDWLGFSVKIGATKVEMLINSIINQFYFRTLGVQFHPDVRYGEDAKPGMKRQILAGIIRETNRIADVEGFFSGLDRLYEIRDCFEDPEYVKQLQKERPDTFSGKPPEVSALERLHKEFVSTASNVEAELIKVLGSPAERN